MPAHLNAVVKTTKISRALQATQGNPSHCAGTLSSQFSTVAAEKAPAQNLARSQYTTHYTLQPIQYTYGSKGPGWILCRIVSLILQLRSLDTPILKQAKTKVTLCSALFCL